MYNRPSPMSARNRYQSLDLASRMEGASPHALVSILYEELERALDIAIHAIASEQRITANSQIARAQSILIALESGLDLERGGELAETLGVIYRAMLRQLAKAGHDSAKIGEVKTGIVEMARSWRAIAG